MIHRWNKKFVKQQGRSECWTSELFWSEKPDSIHACEFAALCMHQERASLTDRQKTSLRRDDRIPFKSVLPPDKDSNQTLTAS